MPATTKSNTGVCEKRPRSPKRQSQTYAASSPSEACGKDEPAR